MIDGSAVGDFAWEAEIAATAQTLRYPATPDLAVRWAQGAGERRRAETRLLRPVLVSGAIALLLCIGLLASPLRADLLEWLRIGSVSIRLGDEHVALPANIDSATELDEVLTHLGGETTLAEAGEKTNLPIMRPSLLPKPDRVFLERVGGGDVLTQLWLDEDGDAPAALLQIMDPASWAMKMEPASAADVVVNGEHALWTTGPYFVVTPNGEFIERRLVTNHALVWPGEMVTYRLESSLVLTDAVRLAESLQRIDGTPVEGEKKP